MNCKPHILQSATPIIKLVLSLFVFYIIAILISPAKIYTAIFYLKVFVPIAAVASAYMIVISKGAEITVDNNNIQLTLNFGRNKSTQIPTSTVVSCDINQGFVGKLFNIYSLKLNTINNDPETNRKASFISQYLVFDKNGSEALKDYINKMTGGTI
ncbi:PH domain-containing protein [Lachnospiraceae bacterium NSJ-143]|nr:PH domain-containing protein [Lachnospiraceae bacterium NSJ-143]